MPHAQAPAGIPSQRVIGEGEMAENQTERRSGEERREAARRGTGPELSIEQVYDGEFGQTAGQTPPEGEQRLLEQRFEIRRKEDRELNEFISGTGTD